MKKIKLNLLFIALFIFTFFVGKINVFAASYNFSGNATAGGGNFISLDDTQGGKYLKVVVNTSGGDTYDLKYVYATDWISTRKVIAEKKTLPAKGKTSTIYFIPSNMSCPGSSGQCVTVPVINGITSSSAVGLGTAVYGIQIHNGSLFGGTLAVSGTYSFIS